MVRLVIWSARIARRDGIASVRIRSRPARKAAAADESTVFRVDVDRDTAEWKLDYWAGTIEQLVEAARLSLERLRALDSIGKRVRTLDSIDKVQIVVEERDDFTAYPKDLDALASTSPAAVHRIKMISISMGRGYEPPSVVIRCSNHRNFYALFVQINGCIDLAG